MRETVIAPKHATYALIGAGKIAARLAKELLPVRRGKTIVVNRTPSNSTEIAAILKAEIRGLDELAPTLAEADVVFAAAAGMSPIVDSSSLSEIANIRAGRPLLVIDLGLPPNLGEGALPNGVRVVRLDELTAKAEANEESRNAAVKHSAAILDEEVERFAEALIERAASPTIRALLEFGENVGKKNIEWALERLPEIDQKQRRVLEELVRRTVVGMLESPIHSLKTDLAWAERRHLLENLFSIGGGE